MTQMAPKVHFKMDQDYFRCYVRKRNQEFLKKQKPSEIINIQAKNISFCQTADQTPVSSNNNNLINITQGHFRTQSNMDMRPPTVVTEHKIDGDEV